jgi:hypothetical protein
VAKSDNRVRTGPGFETVCGKIQVTRDLLREVIGGVRNGRVETRMEFAAGGEAAGRFSCFKQKHALSALREIGGTYQAIMACANDNRVVLLQVDRPFFVIIF